jgi:hypothetical protein
LGIDAIEALDGFGQEITQQLVHRGLTAADHDLRLHAFAGLGAGRGIAARSAWRRANAP